MNLSITLTGVEALKEVLERAKTFGIQGSTSAMTAFGIYMQGQTEKRFQGEHDPEGQKWKPLAPATIRRRLHKSQGVLDSFRSSSQEARRGGKGRRSAISAGLIPIIAASVAGRGLSVLKILTDTAILRRSIQAKASPKRVRILTDTTIYAATHQYGRGKIPARPFLGFNDQDRNTFGEIVAQGLRLAIEKKETAQRNREARALKKEQREFRRRIVKG